MKVDLMAMLFPMLSVNKDMFANKEDEVEFKELLGETLLENKESVIANLIYSLNGDKEGNNLEAMLAAILLLEPENLEQLLTEITGEEYFGGEVKSNLKMDQLVAQGETSKLSDSKKFENIDFQKNEVVANQARFRF